MGKGFGGFSLGFDQDEGNYNVVCQSCGRILGVNVGNHEDALRLEEEHLEDTGCKYTGSHVIR